MTDPSPTLTDQEMHDRMVNGWRAGKPHTVCGNGSLDENTANIRRWLPGLIKKYDIESIADAGAGDLFWVSQVQWSVHAYHAYDLIPRRPEVVQWDITRDALPKCDAVLVRMVLNHLDPQRVCMALNLFRQSAKYLIATQFQAESLPQRSPQFARLDLRNEPYNLGEPLEKTQDGAEHYCSLAIWKL